MTEKNEIVLMNFTGVYKEQEFYREEKISWVDVQGLSGCSCYCDGEAREILEKKIADFPAKGIHFVDSGNYHYMSLLWLKKVHRPFRLLVFDNHTDMQPPAFGAFCLRRVGGRGFKGSSFSEGAYPCGTGQKCL